MQLAKSCGSGVVLTLQDMSTSQPLAVQSINGVCPEQVIVSVKMSSRQEFIKHGWHYHGMQFSGTHSIRTT